MANSTHWLSDVELEEVSFVDKGANEGAKISIFKLDKLGDEDMSNAAELQKQTDELLVKVADLTKSLDAEKQSAGVLRGENEKLKKQLEDSLAAAEELKKSADKDKDPIEILKSQMSAEVRKAFEESERQNKANAERIEKMETASAIAKCAAELGTYKHLAIEVEKLAPVLHKMKKSLSEDELAAVKAVFKSADEGLIELYKERGSNNVIDLAGDVVKKVDSMADEVMKSNPSLTREAARAQIWTKHPELRKEYNDRSRKVV